MYTTKLTYETDSHLLAAHIANNTDFEAACFSGDVSQIMSIVETEMEKNKLFTKGSIKLKNDIYRKLAGKEKISYSLGVSILSFVWNSRMSGNGLAVI